MFEYFYIIINLRERERDECTKRFMVEVIGLGKLAQVAAPYTEI